MHAKTQKVLRDHDRDVTTALESVSSLITDAYRNPDPTDQSPWDGRPDPDVLQVAEIGAAQAIALSIRSLTAHLVVGWDLKEDDGPVHDEGGMDDIAARHGWNAAGIARLRRLHASVASARLDAVTPEPIRSVRHLAEGSTFWAKQLGDRQLRFWFLAAGSGITSLDGILAHADSIDASTIRDVTPPPTSPANASEETHRG